MEYTHSASYRQFQSTLPRRERRELAKVLQTSNISIHAPAKGATSPCIIWRCFLCDFNPRSREGSDGFRDVIDAQNADFNPRSREGSDSCRMRSCGAAGCNFNPRSREGSDSVTSAFPPFLRLFQSTLPRRERRQFFFSFCPHFPISIHAPAKGATVLFWYIICIERFQSTLPRRERLCA